MMRGSKNVGHEGRERQRERLDIRRGEEEQEGEQESLHTHTHTHHLCIKGVVVLLAFTMYYLCDCI